MRTTIYELNYGDDGKFFPEYFKSLLEAVECAKRQVFSEWSFVQELEVTDDPVALLNGGGFLSNKIVWSDAPEKFPPSIRKRFKETD